MNPTTLFAILATAITFGVLAAVLWPLWRQRPLLLALSVLALTLPVLGLYRMVGTPAALAPPAQAEGPTDLRQALQQLRAALEQDPDQVEGWALLGRSLASLGEMEEASQAYARAVALAPDEPSLLVDAAEARALAHPQRRFDEQAVQWLRHALEVQPGHARGTWFLGVWQRQNGQAAEAAQTWEPLLATVDEATARSLRAQINEARAEAGLPALAGAEAAARGPGLDVRLRLDPQFATRAGLDGEATVFVIARIPGGPPMPVAVERHRLADLPLQLRLDDADSPMPTRKLSDLAEVEVLARVSASGSANRGQGDIESAPVRVKLPAGGPVELVLGTPAEP